LLMAPADSSGGKGCGRRKQRQRRGQTTAAIAAEMAIVAAARTAAARTASTETAAAETVAAETAAAETVAAAAPTVAEVATDAAAAASGGGMRY
jgi:hypothetical protein